MIVSARARQTVQYCQIESTTYHTYVTIQPTYPDLAARRKRQAYYLHDGGSIIIIPLSPSVLHHQTKMPRLHAPIRNNSLHHPPTGDILVRHVQFTRGSDAADSAGAKD